MSTRVCAGVGIRRFVKRLYENRKNSRAILKLVCVARTRYSGASEGLVTLLPFRWRQGKRGKLRPIFERAREDIEQRIERSVIVPFHGSAERFFNSMIARDERRIGTSHCLRTL